MLFACVQIMQSFPGGTRIDAGCFRQLQKHSSSLEVCSGHQCCRKTQKPDCLPLYIAPWSMTLPKYHNSHKSDKESPLQDEKLAQTIAYLLNGLGLVRVGKAQITHVWIGTCQAVGLTVSPAEAEHDERLHVVTLQALDELHQVILQRRQIQR